MSKFSAIAYIHAPTQAISPCVAAVVSLSNTHTHSLFFSPSPSYTDDFRESPERGRHSPFRKIHDCMLVNDLEINVSRPFPETLECPFPQITEISLGEQCLNSKLS